MSNNLPETWINTYNDLLEFVNMFYEIDVDVVKYTMFSRHQLLKNWDFYVWLNEQINSSDPDILNIMETFFRNKENRLFVIGFFRSGFVNKDRCKIYDCLNELSKNYLNLPILGFSQHTQTHLLQHERFINKLKKMLYFLHEYHETHKSNLQNKASWESRRLIYNRWSQLNTSFKMCYGMLRYGFERKLWVDFNKMKYIDDFFNIYYSPKPTKNTSMPRKRTSPTPQLKISLIKPKIKNLIHMMSSNDAKKLKCAMKQFYYYNMQYVRHLGKMTCKATRDLWRMFIVENIDLIQKCFMANTRMGCKIITKNEISNEEKKDCDEMPVVEETKDYTDEEFREFVVETFL
jgi:hypothetical protein